MNFLFKFSAPIFPCRFNSSRSIIYIFLCFVSNVDNITLQLENSLKQVIESFVSCTILKWHHFRNCGWIRINLVNTLIKPSIYAIHNKNWLFTFFNLSTNISDKVMRIVFRFCNVNLIILILNDRVKDFNSFRCFVAFNPCRFYAAIPIKNINLPVGKVQSNTRFSSFRFSPNPQYHSGLSICSLFSHELLKLIVKLLLLRSKIHCICISFFIC